MIQAMLASDRRYNGRFIIGVLTTGIYCLPSCNPPRKPKPENVRFFASCEEARAFGLRACKKCQPDEFERGENPELDQLEALVATVRKDPARFGCVPDLADALSVGPTKLFELFRQHYHSSPGDILTSARIDMAKRRLLESKDGIAEIAFEVGFETLSAFNENFKRRIGLTPSEYRQLPSHEKVKLQLPAGYDLATFRSALGRDPNSPSERVEGGQATLAFRTKRGPACIQLLFDQYDQYDLSVQFEKGNPAEAFDALLKILGIAQDPRAFEQQAIQNGFERLIANRLGARIPQAPTLFDGLIWVVVGQQINLPFAFLLRRRLFEAYGEPLGNGLYATPTPEKLANANPDDLLKMQFSRSKANYLIGIAGLGRAWLDSFEAKSATSANNELLKVKGLGPWSANYLMMRALGFMDCVPYGDTGLQAGLRRLYNIEGKPSREETDRLMEPFAPYRSLATFHLWQSLKEKA